MRTPTKTLNLSVQRPAEAAGAARRSGSAATDG